MYKGAIMRTYANQLACQRARLLLLLFCLLALALSACAPGSGIFSGGSWQKGGLQNQHLQALTVDPNQLRNIYAGDAQNGVFVSNDAGSTWKQSNTGLPRPISVAALSFDIPGKLLYAATSTGLFFSNNSAATWHAMTGMPTDSYTALTFDVNAPQTIYVGATHVGVLKSRDGGIHWEIISNGLPSGAVTSLLYDANLKQLWAAFAHGLYRSDDQGEHWHAMSNGLPANVGINALALGEVPSNNSSLLFAGTNHGFFRSTDAGQHWAPSQLKLTNLRISAVLVDVTQPNVVYITTDLGVLRSQDNGQNWSQFASGLPANQPISNLVQGSDNNTQLFVASHGIYAYPGKSGIFNPAQFFPILLVLLFFGLLYWFFVVRRRRSAIKRAARINIVNSQHAQKDV